MRFKRLLAVGLAGFLMSAVLAYPASARLDELILKDRPYESPVAQAVSTRYLVREGDSLWQIADDLRVSLEVLLEVNGLQDPGFIKPGQLLVVPGTSLQHQVRDGENLTTIAALYQASVDELVRENKLGSPDNIFPGQQLRVSASPQGGPVVPAASWRSLIWPVNGPLTSVFGEIRDNGETHYGIDIAADQGELIRAAEAGRVIFAGPAGTFGLLVLLDHGDGLTTYYAHCSEIKVSYGDRINAGEPIALVGNTGRSFGPHLHFEVRWNDQPFDPMLYLSGMGL